MQDTNTKQKHSKKPSWKRKAERQERKEAESDYKATKAYNPEGYGKQRTQFLDRVVDIMVNTRYPTFQMNLVLREQA